MTGQTDNNSKKNPMSRLTKTVAFTLLLGWILVGSAAEPFVVDDIRVEGLQRISAGTVFNYLPIKIGDRIEESVTADEIRALFQTGFFKDIRIEREGDTLVVFVTERPSIDNIEFSGNKSVDTEDLEEQLKTIGFAEGRVFNRSDFDQVEQELERLYFGLGKYAVQVKSTVTPLERNRVGVRFDISEGKAARIKQINIVGNEVFDEEDLLDLFNLTTSGWFTWFTKRDQYSRQKLAADLEILRAHYLDRGYINFNIDSTQVSLTPDKKDVYITVNVSEGAEYTLSEVNLAGDLIVDEEELFDKITVSRGDVFSRKEITKSSADLAGRLGDEGYAFSNVNAIPEVNEEDKTVAVTFFVDPGKRVYVRRINFRGNTKTRDVVLRREMRQMEAGWISTSAVERSRVRLQRLGFFNEVNVETPAVPGTTDQVDVNFSLEERPSGNLVAGLGFSQDQGVIVSASVTQENFLGTGNRVSATFNNSRANRQFQVSYLNPYYTIDGISRGFDAYYRTTDAADANVSDYTTDELGAGVTFGIPITEFDQINVGLAAERIDFKPGVNPSREVLAFRDSAGDQFTNLLLTASFARDTRNSRLLPDRGRLSSISTEIGLPILDLSYYKLRLRHQQFFPLARDFVLVADGTFGYGDGISGTDRLPLIDNFFAGGIRSVRGYEGNTLGPRDSLGEPLGGSKLLTGSLELIVPLPFVENSRQVRLTGFFDFGNVFGQGDDLDLGELRTSAGVSAIWLSPLGALTFSFAVPLNDESQDDTQPLQFTFGTSF